MLRFRFLQAPMSIHCDKTLILSSIDVKQIVAHYGLNSLMDTLIERLTIAINTFDPEKTSIPVRSGFNYTKPYTGLVEWMPVYNQGENVLLKLVGYHPANSSEFNLPTIISTISTYNTKTGHLSALMDGVLATAFRTGAASAVASKCMADLESSTLGLIGCGAQSVTQLHALSRVFELKRVLIFDTDSDAISSFANRVSVLDLEIEIAKSNIKEIVETSDILCTATSIDIGAGPLFSELNTKPHLHINAVGSDFPGKVEIPMDFLQQSFVCPDFTEQAVLEGECQRLDKKDIGNDLVGVVKNLDSYKNIQSKRSVFDSTGWALEDNVVMDLFLDCAAELGLGQKLEIENMPKDTKNPYDFVIVETTKTEIENSKVLKAISSLAA